MNYMTILKILSFVWFSAAILMSLNFIIGNLERGFFFAGFYIASRTLVGVINEYQNTDGK